MTITPSIRPRRSALYLPANNVRAVEKARSLPCDAVILDLEDTIRPEVKLQARSAAVEAVRDGRFEHREVVIRVNGLDTPWGLDDMAEAAQARPDAVLVSKISSSSELAAARVALGDAVPIWAMIETCEAVLQLNDIGAASVDSGVDVWVIGTSDLAKEMRCAHTVERPGLLTALSMSVMAARAFGLAILDGVFTDISDPEGLAIQCSQGVALGFDGKTVLHPSQLEITNRAFALDLAARTAGAVYGMPTTAGVVSPSSDRM
ncbi:CoA ester lyase [Paraburkholderia sp. BR10954]|uniref:CoA ester lyase n=1 Tax=Paraburkholderia sp. BR10954 TaxID=3236995 RepID=UPI0034D2FFD6